MTRFYFYATLCSHPTPDPREQASFSSPSSSESREAHTGKFISFSTTRRDRDCKLCAKQPIPRRSLKKECERSCLLLIFTHPCRFPLYCCFEDNNRTPYCFRPKYRRETKTNPSQQWTLDPMTGHISSGPSRDGPSSRTWGAPPRRRRSRPLSARTTSAS